MKINKKAMRSLIVKILAIAIILLMVFTGFFVIFRGSS